ncbi:caspase family protein [Pontibacter sp. H259]|uniref:caspase family protein n=1 Tax=Pontibacter sp. H259 TaxID=3133421 RepID=UPI0030C0EBD4
MIKKQGAQKRTALVIGMASYIEASPLPLCKNDVDSIADVLRKLNFEVLPYKDLTKQELENIITKWASTLEGYDVALFYYSGHGAEVQGGNYLFPIDASRTTPAQQKYSTVSVQQILDVFGQGIDAKGSRLKTNILILDACRNNPYTKSWVKSPGSEGGIVNMTNIPNGTFIGFATAPGKVASAIGKTNSPYTEAILRNIVSPNESIDDIFTNVNATTRYITGGEQTPFKNSSLDSKFYFTTNKALTKSHSKQINENVESQNSANKIIDFANILPLGSSIDDVIINEYGQQYSKSVAYKDLPIASECKNKLIKYYWIKLSESKHRYEIEAYLKAYGLTNQVRDDSYIVYMFSENKLVMVSIRLLFDNIEFHKSLARSFNIDINKYPSKFSYDNGKYFSLFALEPHINVSTIAVGERATEQYCSFYWYSDFTEAK